MTSRISRGDRDSLGYVAYRKVGRRRLIPRQHLEQFFESTPGTGRPRGTGDSPQRTGAGAL
jgi:hypothetical protein